MLLVTQIEDFTIAAAAACKMIMTCRQDLMGLKEGSYPMKGTILTADGMFP